VIGRTVSESESAWPEPIHANEGAPNVTIFVQYDDGYGQMSAFRGLVNTPNIDRLAQNGFRYDFESIGQPDSRQGRGTPGRGQLYINDQLLGNTDFPTTVPITFGIEGLS